MTSIFELAVTAAQSAGNSILLAASDIASLKVEQKTLHDYVSEVDRNSERIVVEHIQSAFPDHQILGEEFGDQGQPQSDYQWIIDPLDGTTNFLRSIPHYAVSIAVTKAGVVQHGVVYDPAKDDLFTASLGQGATLNGLPISASGRPSFKGSLLATGVPFSGDNLSNVDVFTNTMTDLLKLETSGIRRLGAAALDLAYVAAGRYDGYWEPNLKVWDIAAGALIVQEAGGMVSDLHGGNRYLESGDILAATKMVHPVMASVTAKYY